MYLGDTVGEAVRALGVSIVMPCLNEEISLPHCIANAREALARIEARYGLAGEIVVADNGSTDRSIAIAEAAGARVVAVRDKGYGAALIGGCRAAFGTYLLMGDADGSYDFTDGVAMIGALAEGAGLCMGSRFAGGIAPGAMPWKNRHIGNPVLTGVLNLFFRSGISDAHCGLRAITRDTFDALRLTGTGMEFASEMVIKASLRRVTIAEVPATLSRDLRDRPPHLRPWRDGWRHLRYLFMLSPMWLFGVPGLAAMLLASAILGMAFLHLVGALAGTGHFGASWSIVAGFLFLSGQTAAILGVATALHGVREGYRMMSPRLSRLVRRLTLERLLAGGAAMMALSVAGFGAIGAYWSRTAFVALPNILPLVLTAVTGACGLQLVFGGFLLSILAGHRANYLPAASGTEPVSARTPLRLAA